jgi:type IV secretory pathway VirB10-like protein
MKRCTECNSLFPDAEQFCELDGTPLIAAEDASEGVVINRPQQSAASRSLMPIVAVAGVFLGVLVFLVYFSLTRKSAPENSSPTTSTASVAEPQFPTQPVRPVPVASASPSAEPSPSPSVAPSPSPQASPARIELSSNPISTAAGGKTGPVIIKLDSGVTVEADEAWQTAEGIWYRRHGIVTLVDPSHVKAIDKAPTASPQPTVSPSP